MKQSVFIIGYSNSISLNCDLATDILPYNSEMIWKQQAFIVAYEQCLKVSTTYVYAHSVCATSYFRAGN